MATKKQSRLDKVERVLGQALQMLEAQGNAINFLLDKVKSLDPNEIEVTEPETIEEDELIR